MPTEYIGATGEIEANIGPARSQSWVERTHAGVPEIALQARGRWDQETQGCKRGCQTGIYPLFAGKRRRSGEHGTVS